MVGLIVAYTKNRVIGNKGQIPWRIKGEQRRFKELTTGNVVIMGRRSFDEIGHPLPNRFTIVVSKTADYSFDNCVTVPTLTDAIEYAKKNRPNENIYLSGGAGIYKEGLPYADKLFITEVDAVIEGDTLFPEFDETGYTKTIDERVEGEIPFTYVTYTKNE